MLFLLNSSHAVSFADSSFAFRMVGLSDGQLTGPGAYPPEGESGRARLAAARGTSRASAA